MGQIKITDNCRVHLLFAERGRSYECTSFVETQATALLKEFPVEFVKYPFQQIVLEFTIYYKPGIDYRCLLRSVLCVIFSRHL